MGRQPHVFSNIDVNGNTLDFDDALNIEARHCCRYSRTSRSMRVEGFAASEHAAKILASCEIGPSQTDDCVRGLKNLPEKPMPDLTLYDTCNICGNWDCASGSKPTHTKTQPTSFRTRFTPWQAPSKYTQCPRQPQKSTKNADPKRSVCKLLFSAFLRQDSFS